jgi:outer membrane protein assembly factor BamD (BamD/ComL family)
VDNTPTFNSLLSQLPLTDEQLKKSNDSIKMALFNLGNLYMNSMEDYPSAIETFEKLRTRFPDFNNMNEVLFHLYYAYTKTGNTTQAEQARKLLQDKYPDSRYSTIIATGKDPLAVSKKSPESTKEYEAIYDLFIEGKFEEAEAAKKRADSIYKTNYWQPQLLYIEAVYHIKQRDDSVAKNILQTLIRQSESSPMGEKAKNLLGVLNRRSQIEEELNNLQLEHPQEDSVTTAPPAIVQKQVTPPPVQQTVTQAPPPPEEESMPATQLKRENHINAPRNETGTVSVTRRPPGDTLSRRPALIRQKTASSVYTFDPASKHYAMIILDKVDPIFVNEAKNAFTRFSQESFYNLSLQVTSTDLDADRKMLLIGDFPNAQEAIDYAMKAKRLAPTEIVPWLKADKYSFFIMTDANLEVLRNSKDLTLYKKFLEQNLPVKF